MRSVVEATFTTTATVKRPSGTSDGRGGKAATLTTVSTNQACRVAVQKDSAERQLGQRTTPVGYYKIYFPAGTDVRPKDQLHIGAAVYELIDVTVARSVNLADIATATRLS